MIKLLKLLGFIKCYLCGKIIFKHTAIIRHFVADPNEEWGYPERICRSCDYWCSEHTRG